MSDRKIAGLPDVFVKGGTTTGEWDRQKAQQYKQSDELRAHQDKQRQAVRHAAEKGGAVTGLLSYQLMAPTNPKVVIEFCYNDSALNRECLSELAMQPDPLNPGRVHLVLVLVCPKCLKRTGRQDDAQVMIHSAKKEFHLTMFAEGDPRQHWHSHVDGSYHRLAGTVHTVDRCKCDALGCDWEFQISDSKLRGNEDPHY